MIEKKIIADKFNSNFIWIFVDAADKYPKQMNIKANQEHIIYGEKCRLVGFLETESPSTGRFSTNHSTWTHSRPTVSGERFTHSFKTLASRMERLDQTISDRIRIVDGEISRHSDNEKICEQAACTLKTCDNVIVDVKKELEMLHSLRLEDQKKSLMNLIAKVQKSGMIQDLEKWRSLMESRYIFDNTFSSATPHGVLVEMCQCLELMSSMLRSVEQSIADRNHNGVTEKQLHEFKLAFDYFDQEKNGWLDYEHFELCLKSQGYNFSVESTLKETMSLLDPSTYEKHDYMRYMVKHETTNILDDHSAIEDALKNLDARKISDSMSRKEAEFFMSKIAKKAETSSDQVCLEYKDFVNSFY
ncbi:putative calcium-binding protein C07A9.5 [Caenorhabditis elegans]|uniref:Uncharacterized calcium-binding protein C07A9.5 n=1 Tax=Caenorhabditis elegans TaxID=6239 RepID=YKT5_CAEEL|nr:putative calcium-binding protein C07A9.5 [Caenorhabditis elegans]P34316.2 RecName: Full=Uncharacterized calcium-binding protein C07A9.5 [Caenorhabditis elegans]CAA82343.1 Uncharacterized calcium-binding protein C07A9.5 [Caenorhabditis elegans]|eukprot:NP_499140.1 Uncharacterized calcium-binding protein C07A9.5 [Caenorhabditis elegans]